MLKCILQSPDDSWKETHPHKHHHPRHCHYERPEKSRVLLIHRSPTRVTKKSFVCDGLDVDASEIVRVFLLLVFVTIWYSSQNMHIEYGDVWRIFVFVCHIASSRRNPLCRGIPPNKIFYYEYTSMQYMYACTLSE